MNPKHIEKNVIDFAWITLGTAIAAAAVFFFLIPSHLTISSISAVAVMLTNFIPLPISAITMLLNVILLIIGILCIGKEFSGKTIYTSLLLPVFLAVFEQIFPHYTSMTDDPFLDMLGYVFVVSIGQAMLFHRNASSGGLDIVAKLLNKFLHMELGKALSAARHVRSAFRRFSL